MTCSHQSTMRWHSRLSLPQEVGLHTDHHGVRERFVIILRHLMILGPNLNHYQYRCVGVRERVCVCEGESVCM